MNLENNSLDDDQLGRVRTPQEVAKRALVLIGIFQAATGRNKEAVIKILKKNSLWSEVSELEKKFLETSDDESKFISMQYSWRSESIYILLWALEHFDFEAIPKNEKNLEKIGNLLKTDDFHKPGSVINKLLFNLLNAETAIKPFINIPIGTSLIAVLSKQPEKT